MQTIRRGSVPDGLGAIFATILRIREVIDDPGDALHVSVGDGEVGDMVRALEARLIGYDTERRQLTMSLRLSDGRNGTLQRRTMDAELALATLQQTIELRLTPRSTKLFN